MIIQRDRYIQELVNRMHNGLVKVITGMRRSGKSFLIFTLFREYLLNNACDESHIISIALDTLENERFLDPYVLLDYIKSRLADNSTYYILLDEIQLLPKFEKVLNSLLHLPNTDIYVTGSNSKFLSRDIITEFRGRGDEIHVFPLSFYEFMSAFTGDRYEGWRRYLLFGGMPYLLSVQTDEQRQSYLINLFKETYIKDIIEHNSLRRTQELDDLVDILASAIGSNTNPTRIADTYKSQYNSRISADTVSCYISLLEDAFLINEAQRYDVKGRKYIGSPKKYYFEDVGLRNARIGFRQGEETHLMENVIYNELKLRGYSVDVGIISTRETDHEGIRKRKQLEVDFVATKGSDKCYIQSVFRMVGQEKEDQEKAPLLGIPDSFRKIIISGEPVIRQYDANGILTMSIYDLLLDPNSLN